ncbi:MAG TPA: FHA domain-containing protein [Kofleriaceae bacterium]|nr:FHA domain-containing protein [Kofleriaceae bacterium]
MRCSKCGHDSPPGSSFCLQCGTSLAAPMGYPGQTPAPGGGLPAGCPTCGTENAPNMRFCRNCGTVLGQAQQPGILPTPYMGGGGGGVVAGSIGNSGSGPAPMGPGPMGGMPGMGGPPPPMPGPGSGPMHGMPQPMGPGPMGPGPMGGMPGMGAGPMGPGPGPMSGGPMGGMSPGPMGGGPMGGGPMGGGPMGPGPMGGGPGSMGGGHGSMGGGPGSMGGGMGGMPSASPTTCPRCSAPALPGFAFCQQCGFRLGAPEARPAPIDAQGATLAATGADAANVRAAMGPGPMGPGPMGPGPMGGMPGVGPGPMGGGPMGGMPGMGPGPMGGGPMGGMGGGMPPMASPAPAAVAAPPPSAAAHGAAWGTAVSVNRDGSDGERFPLANEYVIVGRAGADISFEQDRFLARHHARLEQTADGCRVVPIDTQNGVFRKIDAPVELQNGTTVLVGREVLRFEKVEADEKQPDPLVRHGVALFGSPPREPWGRLLQMLPSGGVRDVRHMWDDEITIGREEGDLVYSDDAFLSRRHCTIGWDGNRAVITDLGSSNGTFVRLGGTTTVKNGEHVRMGDQLFRIELRR